MKAETKNLLRNYYLAYRRANGLAKAKTVKLTCKAGGYFVITSGTAGYGYSVVQKSKLLEMTDVLNSRLAKD
jgi:hypothetical protein